MSPVSFWLMSSVCVCLCGRKRRRRAFLRWSSPESPWLHPEWVSQHHAAALFKSSFSNTNLSLRSIPPPLHSPLPSVSHPAHHHAKAGKIQVHAEDYVSAWANPSDAGGSVVSREESSWGGSDLISTEVPSRPPHPPSTHPLLVLCLHSLVFMVPAACSLFPQRW